MNNPLIIAYYLPQFHPFKENDEWWGKGFTEWTNVGKAKPLFKGHQQPKVPADLGYYDLRLPIVREQQAELAKEAGVGAFCYWHYWFGGKGRQLMNSIIDEVHSSKKPDFPFCLGWANESWKSKLWNKDGKGDKVIMEQMYGGVDDYRLHYEYASNLFKDPRYVRVNNKPFFLVYKPQQFEEISNFIKLWNKWIKEDGIADGVYFVANMDDESEYDRWIEAGFDAVTPGMSVRTNVVKHKTILERLIGSIFRRFKNRPILNDFERICENIWQDSSDKKETTIPFVIPSWDHSPRSGAKGRVFVNVTPKLFQRQCERVLTGIKNKDNKLVMLKSWNEWAEGNYMEPDLQNGKGFINALRDAINNCYPDDKQ